MTQIRLLYATDLHGSDLMFRKFISAIILYRANIAIIGGDITGKGIIPVVRRSNDIHEASLYGTRYVARSSDELESLLKSLSNYGFYPLIVREEDLSKLDKPEYFDEMFRELAIKRIREWINHAESKLKGMNVELYMMPGNDDPYDIDSAFAGDIVINHARKTIEVLNGKYMLIGYDKTNITPWRCPRDVDENIIEKELTDLLSEAKENKPILLNTHCPPYGTLLDLAPKLDKDLKPVVSGGSIVTEHVGCISVRKIIERHQPLIGLHGHIHESRAIDKIKNTVIINPGSAYNEGVLFTALVVLEDSKIKSTMLLKG